MSKLRFNSAEIIDIAIRIEHNGAVFYRRAAAARKDGEDRTFLLELAAMEDEHERTFAALRQKMPDRDTGLPPAYDEEAGLYLEALADYHRGEGNRSAADGLTGRETLEEIIRLALKLEWNSILYYESLRPLVPVELGSDQVDFVIAEERSHVAVLQSKMRELKSGRP